ncbi:MAG: hypothetical protein QOC83_3121 [Pseudonocardiales bacterium]|nr:hypothetical protein [Pseudonocardiales bacterium]
MATFVATRTGGHDPAPDHGTDRPHGPGQRRHATQPTARTGPAKPRRATPPTAPGHPSQPRRATPATRAAPPPQPTEPGPAPAPSAASPGRPVQRDPDDRGASVETRFAGSSFAVSLTAAPLNPYRPRCSATSVGVS